MGMYLTRDRFMSDAYDALKSFTLTVEERRQKFEQVESSLMI